MKDVVLHCSILFTWNEIVWGRVRVRVRVRSVLHEDVNLAYLAHGITQNKWSFIYGGAPAILASRIEEHSRVQNKSTPAGRYETKAQNFSRIDIVYGDFQSSVISVLCNPHVITKQVRSVINRQSILNPRYEPFFKGI